MGDQKFRQTWSWTVPTEPPGNNQNDETFFPKKFGNLKAADSSKQVPADIVNRVVKLKESLTRARDECSELRQDASDLQEYSNAKVARVTRYLGVLAEKARKLDHAASDSEDRITPLKRERKKLFNDLITIKDCAKIQSMGKGKLVHAHIMKRKLKPFIFLWNTLIHMYVKCGGICNAYQVFVLMPFRNLFTWNVMITGHAQNGEGKAVITLFYRMQAENMVPDGVTFVGILSACAHMLALERGKFFHACVLIHACESNIRVGNTLINMYAKCQSIENAWHMFAQMPKRNIASWNSIIAGFVHCKNESKEAFRLLEQMQYDLKPDKITFLTVIGSCIHCAFWEEGKRVHSQALNTEWDSDVFLAGCLVDMYAKSGSLDNACEIFDRMNTQNLVSWNALISGYVQHAYNNEALKIFQHMLDESIKFDTRTFSGALAACAGLGALAQGRQIHKTMLESGCEIDMVICATLIDMYCKCGCIEDAHQIFDSMAVRDAVTWNVMIAGCAWHGDGKEVVSLAYQMQHEGLKPDAVTFLSILAACSHACLVDEAHLFLDSMGHVYGIVVTEEHYVCMVDLFGRTGYLEEAGDFITCMPLEFSTTSLMSLLGSCIKYHEVM